MKNKERTSLFSSSEQLRFFRKVPWTLSGQIAANQALQRCIENESQRLAKLPSDLTFSLICPMYNTDPVHLQEMIWSCQLQSYRHWELLLYDDCSSKSDHIPIANNAAQSDKRIKFIQGHKNGGISAGRNAAIDHARGDYICILDHDDLLHPQILGIYRRVLMQSPGHNFLYCNEVKINSEGNRLSDFHCKPSFSHSTLLRTNYICHFVAIKHDILEQIRLPNGDIFLPANDGFEDHHVFLRLAQLEQFNPRHVPVFGYYWRRAATSTASNVGVKPDIWNRDREMVREFAGEDSDIAIAGERGANKLHSIHRMESRKSKVTVIVPFKDQFALTERCLESLERQTCQRMTVVLVDNASVESETQAGIQKWAGAPKNQTYIMDRDEGPFNYSAINNRAVKNHSQDADFILFLNNDVELVSKNAISAMVAEMEHNPHVGVCGLRLNYPDNRGMQHGGIGLRSDASRLLRIRHLTLPKEYTHDEHIAFAVTFACALVRKSVFELLGGFDETFFANGLSDVDFCCRAQKAGFETFYFGSLIGIHHESATRTAQAEEFEILILNEKHPDVLAHAYVGQYGYDLVVPSEDTSDWFEVPLRYKIADAVNSRVKAWFAPAHRKLKKHLNRTETC